MDVIFIKMEDFTSYVIITQTLVNKLKYKATENNYIVPMDIFVINQIFLPYCRPICHIINHISIETRHVSQYNHFQFNKS